MGVNSQSVADVIRAGSWVEIRHNVLEPSERAPHVPEDTRQVPLEMRARGFLLHPAKLDAEVEIETMAGRRLRGVLHSVKPGYTHGFGPPVQELLGIAAELRALLGQRDRES